MIHWKNDKQYFKRGQWQSAILLRRPTNQKLKHVSFCILKIIFVHMYMYYICYWINTVYRRLLVTVHVANFVLACRNVYSPERIFTWTDCVWQYNITIIVFLTTHHSIILRSMFIPLGGHNQVMTKKRQWQNPPDRVRCRQCPTPEGTRMYPQGLTPNPTLPQRHQRHPTRSRTDPVVK